MRNRDLNYLITDLRRLSSATLFNMYSIPLILGILYVLFAIFSLYKLLRFGCRDKRLPPGPPTIPILGNAHLIPSHGLQYKSVATT